MPESLKPISEKIKIHHAYSDGDPRVGFRVEGHKGLCLDIIYLHATICDDHFLLWERNDYDSKDHSFGVAHGVNDAETKLYDRAVWRAKRLQELCKRLQPIKIVYSWIERKGLTLEEQEIEVGEREGELAMTVS